MKLSVLLASAMLFLPLAARTQAPQGRVSEGLSLDSKILGRPVRYTVYVPPGYDHSERRYPVVYLLHGYTDDDSGWLQFGEAPQIADDAIARRDIPPMILVMPDGGVSWYINDYAGKERYEDFLVGELIPHIDASLRTRASKEFRGIAGLSMGGHGALITAMRHPGLFAACAAFSSAIWTEAELDRMQEEDYRRMFAALYGPGVGPSRANDHFRAYSVLHQASHLPEAQLRSVRWYLDCGDDDFLALFNDELRKIFFERKIPHQYRVRDGGHTWSYWRSGLPEGLRFIGESFHR